MPTRLFLGIDAGQSGTAAVLANAEGYLIGVGHGGPVGHHEELGAADRARASLREAVRQAMEPSGAMPPQACCISTTGTGRVIEDELRELFPAISSIVVNGDAMAALAAGTGGPAGLGLIAGTGTVALARSATGQSTARGGWGWLMGDQGSGFWIGIESLRAAARAEDGIGPVTSLARVLPRFLGETDLRGVYNQVTGRRLNRSAIAALTVQVCAAAEQGDQVANRILAEASRHLVDLVLGTVESATFLKPHEQVVVLSGGVLSPGSLVSGLVETELATRLPAFRVVHPPVPAAVGAYYLAMLQDGQILSAAMRSNSIGQARQWGLAQAKRAFSGQAEPGNGGIR